MKNWKEFPLLALVVIMAFIFSTCDNNTTGGGGGGPSDPEGNENFNVTNTAEWTGALSAIRSNGYNKGYSITVNGNINVPGISNENNGNIGLGWVSGIKVTIKGSGTLTLSSNGSIIRVEQNQTLIIDSSDLTLRGIQSNSAPVINAWGAKLELRNGTISGNSNDDTGGGVNLGGGSTFTMSGGAISGNTAGMGGGGGVFVGETTSFSMSGGAISGNKGGIGGGGGLRVLGSFTMTGGTISGNSGNTGGGLVIFPGGSFSKTGGIIYGKNEGANSNSQLYDGGHVAVYLYSVAANPFFRDKTLSQKDNLSTSNASKATGWDQVDR